MAEGSTCGFAVPLLSLGTLCNRHWRDERLNPEGMRVVTREYVHTSDKPADHVNILGNEDIIRDIITVAAGHGALLQDIIVSPIVRLLSSQFCAPLVLPILRIWGINACGPLINISVTAQSDYISMVN